MKKRTKLTVLGLTVLAGTVLLSGCTASFCSPSDKAHILYAFDYGVSDYYEASEIDVNEKDPDGELLYRPIFDGNTNVYYRVVVPASGSGVGKTNTDAAKNSVIAPTLQYYEKMDQLVLYSALVNCNPGTPVEELTQNATYEQVITALDSYGYLKFAPATMDDKGILTEVTNDKKIKLWAGWDALNQRLRDTVADPTKDLTADTADDLNIDDLPNNDYLTLYKNDLTRTINSYRSCIAISEGDYGYYGYANGMHYRDADKVSVDIQAKDWGYAWKKGFLEGLLVFPIAWLTETFVHGFKNIHVPGGLAQLLAIFAITFIVRSLMLLVTLKQTTSTAKMQNLQPEITKIQNKYPNANKNTYEKQQMAAEMSKLYKKNKINPLGSLLVMVVQFPVFICVWGALQGCASLSSDSLFNLHLSDSINGVLFNGANWSNGSAPTALVLFLLMAGAQVVSMLLPQWLQKMKAKKVASLGKNPSQKEQQNKMKMFTYIMMAMIIFMGFTLPSAMGVYWFVGALYSIGQTLIIDKINSRKSKKKGR